MNIFSNLVFMDAAAFPTGREMTLETPAEVVAPTGDYADQSPWNYAMFVYEGQTAYVKIDRWDYPVGTKLTKFTVTEYGRIGRRRDNRFHPEDAKTSEEKYWMVTETF